MTRNRYHGALLLLFFLLSLSSVEAQKTGVDFRQGANNDRPLQLGEVNWVQSVLQGNNSQYFEGMSVPQRILLQNIKPTKGNVHTLTFRHLATKGGKHAYDFLTSYDQAKMAADAIAGPGILYDLRECERGFSPPAASSQQTCVQLRNATPPVLVALPQLLGSTLSHSITDAAANYESAFGSRTLTMYGDAGISSAVMQFNGYSGNHDLYAEYTLTWVSPATSILIEMAGHLALGDDVASAGTGVAYGTGLGAGSISGAPFHFKLGTLDGKALGSQDNQIQGNSIQIPISCNVSGPAAVCAGTSSVFAFSTNNANVQYSWTLQNNSSGASIIGPANQAQVEVDAGASAGSYELLVTVTSGAQSITCTTSVTVSGITVTASPTPILCYGGTSTVTVSAAGGAAPYRGIGSFSVAAGQHDFTVTDANGCSSTVQVNITEPTQISATAAVTGSGCMNNSPTITVSVAATGGTPPYTGTGTFTVPAGTSIFPVTDANGCKATAYLPALRSVQFRASATATPILCNGGTSTVTVSAVGGNPPYTGTGTFTVTAGTHNYTVTDANGCSASTTVTVSQPASPLAASATATPLTCGVTSSTVTVSATGGTPPYSGIGTFSAPAGTHTFTVTDNNGCSANTTVTIQGPTTQLAVSAVATSPISCYGGTTTVTVSATGGTGPYTGTGTFTRSAGTWTFTVTDANSCSGTASVTLTQPSSALTATAAANGSISCYGGTTTVTVSATGGTGPYTGTGTFTESAGTHSYTVTDANGCATTTSITLTQPSSALSASASVNGPVSCNGGTTTVTVAATGGTAPYTGTGTFTVGAGTHNYTVTDANGCTDAVSITVTQPSNAVSASATASGPITCYGGTTTVTVSATGGTAPYTGTGTFTVGAGTHSYTVTDANSCSATVSITLTQPSSALTAAASANGPISCFGGTTTVTVSAGGGAPPYTGTGTFTESAGTHSYTVTDANGCTA